MGDINWIGQFSNFDDFVRALMKRLSELGLESNLIPLTNVAQDVGSSSKKFKAGYIQTLYSAWAIFSAQIYFTGIVAKTTTYTATSSETVILVDTSGGAWTLSLPAVATVEGGIFIIKKTDVSGNALTIDGDGAETIDGAATNAEIDAQFDMLWLLCDGTEWHIIGRWIH